jgi:hypothetical protein
MLMPPGTRHDYFGSCGICDVIQRLDAKGVRPVKASPCGIVPTVEDTINIEENKVTSE